MKLYLISYFNWEDSEHILIGSKTEYSDEKFKELCDEAYEKYKYRSEHWKKDKYIVNADDIANYLIEYYDFEYYTIKEYDSNNNCVKIIEDGWI